LTESEKITLPQLQLLVLFLCSVFFILPITLVGNLVGVLALGIIIVFYLITELNWLKSQFNLGNKQVAFNLALLGFSGYMAFEVFFLLGILAVFPISKFYKWP